MPRSHFTLLLLFLAFGLHAGHTHHERLVHFEKDKAELTPAAQAALDQLLKDCPLSGEFQFTLNGHTDSDGSSSYNRNLSAARSQAVLAYLVQRGVPQEAIRIAHSGETDPIRSNADEQGMAMNRRVAVTFDRRYYKDLDELRADLTAGTTQQFTIDPRIANTVQGTAGVRLDLPAEAFVDADGRTVSGPVTVELTEALGHLAMIGHQLATRSGDRMLETGGMLKVSATDAAGRDLRLRGDRPMDVTVPTDVLQPGMELFLSNDGRDWATTNRPLTVVDAWTEPARPILRSVGRMLPTYREDQRGKPMKPTPPGLASAPREPRRESYPPRKGFLSFLRPGLAEAQADQRYRAAMVQYEKRKLAHDRKVAAYEEELRTYPARLRAYDDRMMVWKEKKQAEFNAWDTVVYRPAALAQADLLGVQQQQIDSITEVWRAQRDSSYQRYLESADRTGTGDMGGLQAYMFATTELGWINCDRFYDVPEREKHQVVVDARTKDDAAVYLVFDRIFALMPMERQPSGRWISQRVARNEPAVLFAYAVIDGRPHVSHQKVVKGEQPPLTFEPSSFAEIGKILRGFSRANT